VAVPYLRALAQAGHVLCVVVTQPDRPAGRGRELRTSAVRQDADRLGLPVLQPAACGDPAFRDSLRVTEPDVAAVVAYGNLLPPGVLGCPSLGCVNVHYSLLPKLRGAAPVQRALLEGLTETGVTVQWMSPELDAGDVIVAQPVTIGPDDDAAALFARLNEVGPRLLVEALRLIAAGCAPRVPQDETLVTWAPGLTTEECRVDWTEAAERVRNRVRACAPRPGAYTLRAGRRLKILGVAVVGPTSGTQEGLPGSLAETASDGYPVVYAGCGAVALVAVQPEGRPVMSGQAYARGARLSPGERLG